MRMFLTPLRPFFSSTQYSDLQRYNVQAGSQNSKSYFPYIPLGDCSTEVGWDYTPGTHEAHTSGQNTIDDCRKYCRQTCGLHSGKSRVCQYFTYINDGRCWCKKSKEPRNDKHNLGNTITSGGICDPHTTTTTPAMHEGYNCYPGHGGDLLGPEPFNANLHLADCQKACEGDENCEGFVVPNDVITNKGGDSIAFIFLVHTLQSLVPFLQLFTEMPSKVRFSYIWL